MQAKPSAKSPLLIPLLPHQSAQPEYLGLIEAQILPKNKPRRASHTPTRWLVCCVLALLWVLSSRRSWKKAQGTMAPFFVNITDPGDLCVAPAGPSVSHSGYIGLKGDNEETPKRSFFWLFEAENDSENAPIILTIGGGPGTSGMSNPMAVQGPCVVVENGTASNPNRWTEHFNLLALDHPIGAGFSFGTMVNNSRDAAVDVYDFLQKFYKVFPHLAKNQLVLSGGSYGGIYVPHIATVIHEQNLLIAKNRGQPGAISLNLESMMVSNPISDAASHFRWMLQSRCYLFDMYNSTTCTELFEVLPVCLDAIAYAQQTEEWIPERRTAAIETCGQLAMGDTHGTVVEDTRKKCYSKEPMGCLAPSFFWMEDLFHRPDVKDALGVPEHVNFKFVNEDVTREFMTYGDIIQSSYLLYAPLLKAGIRLLHYVGAQDANCAWPGVISFLKLIQSPFQQQFLASPDVPWPTPADKTTARVVGSGAGNFTWILVDGGGHFIAKDQPVLVKDIVQRWIHNVPYFG
ncbi:SET domain-containing protein [Mycena indigotica]|uniref:SET domain-containing protein n=1 Tax=Mycena indigotica TaxID=2126181 RepID=A0A8H6SFX2_9AGAR|nr:SET domain-containing protein [Mycena indigotica]KAF7298669.1 SET domain-containing protein [Mycena indigotica]